MERVGRSTLNQANLTEPSLRSRRLEVVGERENGRARGRHRRRTFHEFITQYGSSHGKFDNWPRP